MVFSKQIFKDKYTLEESEVTAFLIISFLHFNGKITDDKMKGMFKSLRDKKLLRRINTFHSKINDKWYDSEHMIDILYDIDSCVSSSTDKTEMDIDTILRYTNLFLNKNRNYCVDYIFSEIIKPIVIRLKNNDYYSLSYIESFKLKGFPRIVSYDNFSFDHYGYCCEDCSGCYSNYKRNEYKNYIQHLVNGEIMKCFNSELKSYRVEKHPTQVKTYEL